MKRLILLFLLALLSWKKIYALEFYNGDYPQALQKAKTENKLLLLYFTAKWCGPCKYMEAYIYPDLVLTEYVKQHYVALKIDVDTQDGKLLYIRSHQPKGPMGVPSFIILNEKEEVLRKTVGGMKLDQLKDFFLIDKNTKSIYTLLADSLAKEQLVISQKKPSGFTKFLYNSMFSNWKPALKFGTNIMGYQGKALQNEPVLGYEIGFFMDLSFKYNEKTRPGFWHKARYVFQPGLSITSKGGNIKTNNVEARLTAHYLELGLLNSYQFKGFGYFRLFASPYAATRLWAKTKIDGDPTHHNFSNDFNKMDYGLRFGLSRYMGSFEPYLGYNLGLQDIKTGTEIVHNRGFYLSFALIFGK
ncbi:DUF255 domain-containing protein [Pedobacter frigiditerrae]|uniref:DUF255 domain-containing protein n=1 Tax=Pedobacter frigiditerrae TaxID=2530452 RepID=A0A4R0MUE0_9SPHI|nr:outer membrane beta-barrel protein [Pedobacter frigiditerrae]TCC90357.1 DUF255 domain-containing protein [Pedobacter frigiditerrae]